MRWLSLLLLVAWTGGLVACSSSNGPDGPPGLERIDGPAQVDPSFDPFATVVPTLPSAPSTTATDAGG